MNTNPPLRTNVHENAMIEWNESTRHKHQAYSNWIYIYICNMKWLFTVHELWFFIHQHKSENELSNPHIQQSMCLQLFYAAIIEDASRKFTLLYRIPFQYKNLIEFWRKCGIYWFFSLRSVDPVDSDVRSNPRGVSTLHSTVPFNVDEYKR